MTGRMLQGEGDQRDPDVLKSVADNIAGRTIFAFGEACAWPTQSFVAKFPDEFAAYAAKNGSTAGQDCFKVMSASAELLNVQIDVVWHQFPEVTRGIGACS